MTFYDVESHLEPAPKGRTYLHPFLWVACNVTYHAKDDAQVLDWKHGFTPGDFWDLLNMRTRSRTTRYVVSHHVEADFLPLDGFTNLRARGWVMGHYYQDRLTVYMRWKKADRSLVFLNNAQLLPGRIAEWGKLFDLEKLPMPLPEDPPELWYNYCKRDVEILVRGWQALREFIHQHNLGGFAPTRAGLAKHAYQHRFSVVPVKIHADPELTAFERLAYHGGRCQALRHGRFTAGPYYDLDANGMYASVEMEQPLPHEFITMWNAPPLADVVKVVRHHAVVAEVEVDIQEPVLPVRVADKLGYPTGHQHCFVTTPELAYMLQRGWHVTVLRMAIYRRAPFLAEFARYFSELKEHYTRTGNRVFRQLCKDYPNHIYGKFGQHGSESMIIGETDPSVLMSSDGVDADTGHRFTLSIYGGNIHRTTKSQNAWDTFVAVAAHVTAGARMALWQFMTIAGQDHVYHVATDSLIVDQAGYDSLADYIHPDKVGMLKVELRGQVLTVRGRNDWTLDATTRIKGAQAGGRWLDQDTVINTEWPRLTRWATGRQQGDYFTQDRLKRFARQEYHEVMEGRPTNNGEASGRKKV